MIQQGKTTTTETRSKSASETSAAKSDSRTPPSNDGLRETVESVVVAFVLAFLFRTFEAEAFVIPTGSMAPTLMGRHKDLACEHCGFPYRVSAKDEVDDEGRRFGGIQMETSMCPNCRYTMDLGSRPLQAKYPSFKGDRILVGKFPYSFSSPERWDVVVFKFPIRAHQNFIKRLVGLPNETIRIVHGDIYVKPVTEQDFGIARKPPEKLLAMLQTVYDNDYASPDMVKKGWPPRWQAWAESVNQAVQSGFPQAQQRLADESGDWKVSEDLTEFEYRGEGSEPAWIRYTHTVPSPDDWRRLKEGLPVSATPLKIEDFNAYNMGRSNDARQYHPYYPAWVGDLGVECEVEVATPRAS
jgi:signal peptidase I